MMLSPPPCLYAVDQTEEKKTDPPSPADDRLAVSTIRNNSDVLSMMRSRPVGRENYPSPCSSQRANHAVRDSSPGRRTPHSESNFHGPTATTPCASFRRSPSLDRRRRDMKSWTDQRAPEPFSSPPPKPARQSSCKKKYGYGDLFRSSSSGIGGGGSGVCGGSRSLVGGVRPTTMMSSVRSGTGRSLYHSDRNVFANAASHDPERRGNSEGRITTVSRSRRPSFARSDFPLLSPPKPKKPPPADRGRKASWSEVVGGSERDVMASSASTPSATVTVAETALENASSFGRIAGIPPLPLCDGPSYEANVEGGYIDEEVESVELSPFDGEGEGNLVEGPSEANWQQNLQQRKRSHSFHIYPPDRSSLSLQPVPHTDLHNLFSSFTTMSVSVLQNDIGTLLARSNRVEAAIKRYKLSIASAESVLEGLKRNSREEGESESTYDRRPVEGRWEECPQVTEAEGLAWFRQKLLRGDVIPAHVPVGETVEVEGIEDRKESSSSEPKDVPFQPAGFGGCALDTPRRMRSASFSVADLHPPSKQLSSIGINQSIDEAPGSPLLRPTSLATRMASCPVTAPHPRKTMLQLSRSHSARAAGGSASCYHRHAHDTVHHPPLDDIVHDIHQHQKLDCPDEVYSCNGRTPLGLEYVCDPLPVLGSSLRRLGMSCGDDGGQSGCSMNTKRGAGTQPTAAVESAALIAARLNLASLNYRLAGGGTSEKLQDVLGILEAALKDCHSAFKMAEKEHIDASCGTEFSTLFGLMKAVVLSNIGTVNYRLKKVRDAMASFEEAKIALEDVNGDERTIDFHHSEPHDDSRFPQRAYLLLVVRLNLSRVSVRLNQPDDAKKYCDLIVEDNKPHRKNRGPSLLRKVTGYHYQRGFHRSNSFSAASSALQTSILAYEHDVDRRSKWLASVAEHYISGLIHESRGEASDHKEAWGHYSRLLSLARTKLDHRHPYIVALLERRGAVLFEQRKLPCSMLSYLACLKILEHQQSTGSNVFDRADLSRILYAIARVLHDKEEYHDALHMYQRALAHQRALAVDSGKPSLDVITTLCNISRVHHLSGEIDASLAANREVLDLATTLVGGKMEHPFLIHRLKVEGNILVEAGRMEDAMRTFVEAARRCSEDGRDRMMAAMVGGGGASGEGGGSSGSQEDADAGDSSVLSIRSASALAQINFLHPAAAAA